MKEIALTQGKVALVDDEDYPMLRCLTWSACRDGKNYYPTNGYVGRMHQLLIPVDRPLEVDHIDRNGLNNQRSNLRICTHQQNNWNQDKKRGCTSKYKGVYWHACRRNWMSRMRINGKTTYLGSFSNEQDAAKMYDKHAKIHFGEFAFLNFK